MINQDYDNDLWIICKKSEPKSYPKHTEDVYVYCNDDSYTVACYHDITGTWYETVTEAYVDVCAWTELSDFHKWWKENKGAFPNREDLL